MTTETETRTYASRKSADGAARRAGYNAADIEITQAETPEGFRFAWAPKPGAATTGAPSPGAPPGTAAPAPGTTVV